MVNDRHVVIFGGSSGIGEAVAAQMLARGAAVTIVARDQARLEKASGRLGGLVKTAAVDALDRNGVDAFFAGLEGPIDHLVLSFSSGRAGGPFRNLAMTDLAAAISGKLLAYFSIMQAALASLRPDGSIVLVGAGSAESAIPATAGLAAVNGGLHAAIRPLAVELAPLRVNAVAPGVINTPWWGNTPEQVRAGVFASAAAAPAGRVGVPNDVAKVVAMLIESEFVTGVTVPCDGGLRLK